LVEKLVDDVCEEVGVNEDKYGNILIALTEAVNNAIRHGNASNPEKTTTIQCGQNNKKLKFIIKDEGLGFDYNNIPDPTDPKNIEKTEGRGVKHMWLQRVSHLKLCNQVQVDSCQLLQQLLCHLLKLVVCYQLRLPWW
jgi:anti-sigma regulatory factor (Ser/Thr protein kinase)